MATKKAKQPVAQTQTEPMRIDYVALSEIKKWPRNPKLHDGERIQGSIERFGFVAPITVDSISGQLVAGHGRVEALSTLKAKGGAPPERVTVREDGEWLAPVVRVAFASSAEAEAYLLADNRLVELGGWDETGLKAMLADLHAGDTALTDLIGWNDDEVASILAESETLSSSHTASLNDKLDVFMAAEIKQIVLFLDSKEYEDVVSKLNDLMKQMGAESHTDVVKAAIEVLRTQYAQGPSTAA